MAGWRQALLAAIGAIGLVVGASGCQKQESSEGGGPTAVEELRVGEELVVRGLREVEVLRLVPGASKQMQEGTYAYVSIGQPLARREELKLLRLLLTETQTMMGQPKATFPGYRLKAKGSSYEAESEPISLWLSGAGMLEFKDTYYNLTTKGLEAGRKLVEAAYKSSSN